MQKFPAAVPFGICGKVLLRPSGAESDDSYIIVSMNNGKYCCNIPVFAVSHSLHEEVLAESAELPGQWSSQVQRHLAPSSQACCIEMHPDWTVARSQDHMAFRGMR